MIADLKAREPFLFESERDQPLSDDRIREIEKEKQIKLPDSYRHHLMTKGAGDFGYGMIYSPDPNSGWSLWKEYVYMDGMEDQILPIADNGCGDYYCLPIAEGGVCHDHIVWADHEQDYRVTESDYSDFRSFVASVCLNPA